MADSKNISRDADRKLSEGEFMRLFLQHEPALRALARSILPDWNSVDDALQEASVTMWEKLGQLKGSDGFLPWAKVILRFKCLSAVSVLRRNRRLLRFLKAQEVSEVTFILVRDTGQIAGEGPALVHAFASDSHAEAAGPILEFTFKAQQ